MRFSVLTHPTIAGDYLKVPRHVVRYFAMIIDFFWAIPTWVTLRLLLYILEVNDISTCSIKYLTLRDVSNVVLQTHLLRLSAICYMHFQLLYNTLLHRKQLRPLLRRKCNFCKSLQQHARIKPRIIKVLHVYHQVRSTCRHSIQWNVCAWARHAPEKVYYKAYLRLVSNWVTTSNINGHGSSFFEQTVEEPVVTVPYMSETD